MAIKKTDESGNTGPKGFLKKNFSRDEKGRSILGRTFGGASEGIHLWRKDRSGGGSALGMLAAVWGGFFAAGFVENAIENRVDWTPEYSQQQDATSFGYNIISNADGRSEVNTYFLHQTETGPVLLRAADDIPNDDLFVAVTDFNTASRVAGEISSYLNGIEQAGVYDPDAEVIVTYDGLSVTYENVAEGFRNIDYIIGDNAVTDVNVSLGAIETQSNVWEEALQSFINQQAGQLTAEQQGAHLEEADVSQFMVFMGILGGLAGLGAAGGAVSSVVGSRRRFNDEMKGIKPKATEPKPDPTKGPKP